MTDTRFQKFPLGHFPTPLESMQALKAHLNGPQIFVKRDDCTGLAFGGNKTRKLEYLIADAIAQKADVIVTAGGIQSNHVRQTAAAACRANIPCVALLEEPSFKPDSAFYTSGNILLDKIFGCECLYRAEGQIDMNFEAQAHCDKLRSDGKNPYFVPIGGSNVVGSMGYFEAAAELRAQVDAMGITLDRIVLGTGSAGTHAGMLMGLRAIGWDIAVTGIAVSATSPEKTKAVHDLCVQISKALGNISAPELAEITVLDGYVGKGYGQPNAQTHEAIQMVAQLEGILLDPVYTGKVMAGLIDLIRSGEIAQTDNVLFLHTGGATGLFAYPGVVTPN